MITVMPEPTPLVTMLSQAFVAYTIEFDNEAEHRFPHRTSQGGDLHAPWLVSMAMWFNCLQFLDEEGLSVAELYHRARTRTNLDGMRRWGYITLARDTTSGKTKASSWIVRPTHVGLEAQKAWRPIFKVMQNRWEDRFGEPAVRQVRQSMAKTEEQFDVDLPDCLPILRYGLASSGDRYGPKTGNGKRDSNLLLPILLARMLLAFAIVFEKKSELSLAISANVIRVLGENSVRISEVPQRSGVSKAAVAMALSYLSKRGFATLSKNASASGGKVVRLTKKGRDTQESYSARLRKLEDAWKTRFGDRAISELRDALEAIVGRSAAERARLFLGIKPYPDNWRASVPTPQVLPHFPMVLHRGGYPDGS